MCIHARARAHTHTHTHMCMYVYTYTHTHTQTCIYLYLYVVKTKIQKCQSEIEDVEEDTARLSGLLELKARNKIFTAVLEITFWWQMHVCVFVCVCMYVSMCVFVYVCVCMSVWLCMYLCVCVCVCVYLPVCRHVRVYSFLCVFMYVCVYVHVYAPMYVCAWMYSQIHMFPFSYVTYLFQVQQYNSLKLEINWETNQKRLLEEQKETLTAKCNELKEEIVSLFNCGHMRNCVHQFIELQNT